MPDPTNLPSESRESTSSSQKSAASERLDSWKEIAAYLRRSERTVRRWEATEGLPTHRHGHHRRASVYAFRSELDHWWSTRGAVAASREPEVPAPTSLRWVRIGVAIILLALAGAATLIDRWTRNGNSDRQVDAWRSVAVTSYPGAERFPSLSPDGQQVAFAWHRESSDNYDIYVQLVQGGTPLRLTSHLQHDWSPVWSPDGASIAFLRWSPGLNADLIVVPSLPGAERHLTTVAPLPGRGPICGGHLAWSPDGGWIATSDKEREDEPLGLFLVSAVTGEKRRLTRPDRGQRDTAPSFAPDGTRLAFVRVLSFGISEIFSCGYRRQGIRLETPRPSHETSV